MAPDKTESPSHVLTFAGIEFDCLELETRLLKEKSDKNLKVNSLSSTQKKSTTKGAPIVYRSPAYCLLGYNLGCSSQNSGNCGNKKGFTNLGNFHRILTLIKHVAPFNQ